MIARLIAGVVGFLAGCTGAAFALWIAGGLWAGVWGAFVAHPYPVAGLGGIFALYAMTRD